MWSFSEDDLTRKLTQHQITSWKTVHYSAARLLRGSVTITELRDTNDLLQTAKSNQFLQEKSKCNLTDRGAFKQNNKLQHALKHMWPEMILSKNSFPRLNTLVQNLNSVTSINEQLGVTVLQARISCLL